MVTISAFLRRAAPLMAAMLIVLAPSAGTAESRYALVIGNSVYEDQTELANPANDAELMATSLEGLGFTVFRHFNLDQKDMRRAVLDFGDAMAAASDDDVVSFIYYAGHGLQVDGRNYLVPVDARIKTERDVALEAIAADDMLAMIEQSDTRLNIVVLDACRNNPYQRGFRSAASGGLARMDAPSGTLLAYATAPGAVAADGDGRNSPYTQALVRAMNRPGLAVEEVFKRARVEVMDRTGDQQVPWESSSLTGNFYFSGAAAAGGTAMDAETAFWTSIVTSRDASLFETYLERYPDGAFAPVAKSRMAELQGVQVAAVDSQRSSGDVKFKPGRYKVDIVREESKCIGINFLDVTAEETSAHSVWRHTDADGTIDYEILDGIVTVDLTGPRIKESNEMVQVKGRDLYVRLNIRHDQGKCRLAYHLRGILAP